VIIPLIWADKHNRIYTQVMGNKNKTARQCNHFKIKIMKIKQYLIIYLFGFLVFLDSCDKTPKSGFTYAEPETKGYSSQKLELLKEHLEKSGSSSMMIMVDGAIVFDWGETSKKHTIHSIRKALLNSLVGIAIEQGKIRWGSSFRSSLSMLCLSLKHL
jgi:hypothetical protein